MYPHDGFAVCCAGRLGDANGHDQVIRYGGLDVEMQLVAALDQVERHRLAHDAEPDETDLHGGNLPLGCAVDWVDSTRSAWPRQAFPAGTGQAGADYDRASRSAVGPRGDRQSVGEGRRGAVRGDSGGARTL